MSVTAILDRNIRPLYNNSIEEHCDKRLASDKAKLYWFYRYNRHLPEWRLQLFFVNFSVTVIPNT